MRCTVLPHKTLPVCIRGIDGSYLFHVKDMLNKSVLDSGGFDDGIEISNGLFRLVRADRKIELLFVCSAWYVRNTSKCM